MTKSAQKKILTFMITLVTLANAKVAEGHFRATAYSRDTMLIAGIVSGSFFLVLNKQNKSEKNSPLPTIKPKLENSLINNKSVTSCILNYLSNSTTETNSPLNEWKHDLKNGVPVRTNLTIYSKPKWGYVFDFSTLFAKALQHENPFTRNIWGNFEAIRASANSVEIKSNITEKMTTEIPVFEISSLKNEMNQAGNETQSETDQWTKCEYTEKHRLYENSRTLVSIIKRTCTTKIPYDKLILSSDADRDKKHEEFVRNLEGVYFG